MRVLHFLFLLLFLFCKCALASELNYEQLSADTYWHKLLHYKKSGNRLKSEVISPSFFLSKSGHSDPFAELKMTVKAFLSESEKTPNTTICSFPARYLWLKKQYPRRFTHNILDCKDYLAWTRDNEIKSISVILASGYLSNPASIYGHLLLRFDLEHYAHQGRNLVSPTLNFGAITPPDENMLVYITKGIFGGYEAGFTDELFYKQDHSYAKTELRDLWQYKLNLMPDQLEQLVAHSYELIKKKFTYYFAKENCAYQMARLLQLVVEEPLLNYDSPFAFPTTVFQRLAKVDIMGKPAVDRIDQIPSHQKILHRKYEQLSLKQKKALNQFIEHRHNDHDAALADFTMREQAMVLNVYLDYLDFLKVKDVDIKETKKSVLIALFKRPITPIDWTKKVNDKPPHLGQAPSTLQINLVQNTKIGTYGEFRFRTAYYDLLSNPIGRLPLSSLAMLDASIAIKENDIWIKTLDGVNIKSLNTSKTGLAGDGGYAWQIRAGIEQQELSCQPCNIFSLTGGVGKSIELSNKLALYAMQNAKLQSASLQYKSFSTEIELGAIAKLSSYWRSSLIYSHRFYLHDTDIQLTRYKWENAIHFDRNWEIRLNVEKQIATEMTASFSYFF
ncbi:Lnb N-terminal periplasmic domain-containing protein [Algibacillus agarilyticus]|uniref:Lnb N-terminal periplasmic domain-containing protein n=1 Tax=Algibacillus agarilyticus TaxID=2234133 RepID=UPI000DD03011|nr:DUF4105 domain-containing protein [Algibacillus agarilyticus]